MIKTLTLASIYELQGLKEDALDIYKEILKKDSNNKAARVAVRRLSGIRKKYSGVDEEMKNFFVDMKSQVEFSEFERWLSKL